MSSENTATGAGKGRNRKPKAPTDLDLPASELREITPQAEPAQSAVPEAETLTPESSAQEAPAQAAPEPEATEPVAAPEPAASATPATPSRLVPGAIGLVAGLIGGLGATFLAPVLPLPQGPMQRGPAEPAPIVLERLAKAEAALSEAKTREDALRQDIAALGAKLAGEAESARKAVETLEAKASKLAQPGPEVETLKNRLGALEGESKVLPKELGVLGTRVETLQPKLDSLEKTLETLTGRVANVGSRDAVALANARLAAQGLLEDEFTGGKPYATTLDLLTRTGGEASLLALLKPFAESGAPQSATLLAEMRALKPKAAPPPATENSLMDRARKAALSLVEIRRTGDAAGKDDAALLARIEEALKRMDLGAAHALSGQLSPALAPGFAPWRSRLEARIKAGEAVSLLRKDAQKTLARAAASAK